ncbi:MAG: hydroxymethylbilane synthase [Gammaproteobacteria bacterium]|nr:MAG: hydroxymethylbilane synthase [Gammaproteobacteria bacterium]TLY68916.1 MAG: hydroxymethylbilane synthase [Gammaproteobacteria bacterium]TLZ16796.1 MAG: hydroxymethylbilane synthase [Gammaproteobacteria bacterium]
MSAPRPLRIGTRASQLALWQARHVESLLRARPGAPPVELVHIKTEGDAKTDVPLWQVGGRAFFTKEIDRALLAGTVDVAVHSLKDLATTIEPGVELAATLAREDPRDALLSRNGAPLGELPRGARVGTSSLRRRAFLARARPDAVPLELRGNVPTRIERLRAGDYDAIILAAAGLKRLGLHHHVAEYLPPEAFPPAVSQGVIGVCARTGDEPTLRWLAALDDGKARLAASAERALLRRLEGGCQVPLGALASGDQRSLELIACVCALDGSKALSASAVASASSGAGLSSADAAALGERVAAELLSRGAAGLIARERASLAVEAP